jgi:hypothetical protein
VTTKLAHLLVRVRRTLVVLVAGAFAVVAAAGPAGADVPEGWSDPDPVDPVQAALLLAGVPLLIFVVIGLLVLLPGRIRGERIGPGGQVPDDQWFGGPSKGTAELPAADTEDSRAGGASARW